MNTNTVVLDDAWHHITFSDASGTAALYVDGVKDSTNLNYTRLGVFSDIDVSTIGAVKDNGSYTDWFSGLIDNVKIYDYARTPAQVAWDFNKGKPIAEWNFDECRGGTIGDRAVVWNGGTRNNGTLQLGTTGVTATGTCASSSNSFWYNGRNGKRGNGAGSFDGDSDYVNGSFFDGTVLENSDFTASAWVNLSNISQDTYYIAMSTGADPWPGWEFTIQGNNDWGDCDPGDLCLWTCDGTGGSIAHNGVPHGMSINTWNFIAATFVDSTQEVNFYVNGINVGAKTANQTIGDNELNDFQLGVIEDGLGNDYMIDEVKIFNYALTAEQVRSEYNSGAVYFGGSN
jgi:hypothetical protein